MATHVHGGQANDDDDDDLSSRPPSGPRACTCNSFMKRERVLVAFALLVLHTIYEQWFLSIIFGAQCLSSIDDMQMHTKVNKNVYVFPSYPPVQSIAAYEDGMVIPSPENLRNTLCVLVILNHLLIL